MGEDFFSLAAELSARGEGFVTATVVRAERPTSGKPGDRAIVTGDGRLVGWIGGSCAGPAVVEQGLAALRDGRSRLIRLSPEPEGVVGREGIEELAMTCFSGGTMEIFVEPHLPATRLVVVGESPVARALARLGAAMGYRVVAEGSEREEGGAEVLAGLDGGSCVVVASHGEDDEERVARALAARPAYLGLVASRKRAAAIREYLGRQGVAEADLARLCSPAGLDLGARRPEEIALSILAEIVQVLRGAEEAGAEAGGGAAAEASEAAPEAATAVDPVCGMSVEIAGARHRHEHAGVTYYFCCAGCRTKFADDPARWVTG